MKKTPFLRIFLLMTILTLFHTIPALASQSVTGSLDLFDGTHVSGWVYDQSDPSSVKEVQIQITSAASGSVVKTIAAEPDVSRSDLLHVTQGQTPGFTIETGMSELPDGIYSASAYANGQKFAESVYYGKQTGTDTSTGNTLIPLGTFKQTAYCPCRSCSAGWGSLTSTGAIASEGHTVAVDPRVISLGSRLLINGSVYTAEDVGGGVKGNHIDIFFNSHSQAKQFGRQSASVYLIR